MSIAFDNCTKDATTPPIKPVFMIFLKSSFLIASIKLLNFSANLSNPENIPANKPSKSILKPLPDPIPPKASLIFAKPCANLSNKEEFLKASNKEDTPFPK